MTFQEALQNAQINAFNSASNCYQSPPSSVTTSASLQQWGWSAYQSVPTITIGSYPGVSTPMADGTKPVVVCGGTLEEANDMDAAQSRAEELAHQKSATAYILKPVKKVSPKREVVTTDIAD